MVVGVLGFGGAEGVSHWKHKVEKLLNDDHFLGMGSCAEVWCDGGENLGFFCQSRPIRKGYAGFSIQGGKVGSIFE